MAEPRERFRGEDIDRRPGWYVKLACRVCGKERYVQDRKPYADRCAPCHRAQHGHSLGLLTIPVAERSRLRHYEG